MSESCITTNNPYLGIPDIRNIFGLPRCSPYERPSSIEKVIFNYPATIVIWSDNTKTVVKCQDGDVYDMEKGLALCIAKKFLGNKGNFNDEFKKWIPETTPVTKVMREEKEDVCEDRILSMRRELVQYCAGRKCGNCELKYPNCRCGCGTHFESKNQDDSYNMTDEEIIDAHKKVFGK